MGAYEEMRGERGTVEALTAWRTEHPIQGQQRIDARRKERREKNEHTVGKTKK